MHPQAAAAQPPSAQQDTHRWATFVSRHGNIWTAVEEASQGALSGFGPESGETVARKLAQDLYQVGLAPKGIHAAAAHCPASRTGKSLWFSPLSSCPGRSYQATHGMHSADVDSNGLTMQGSTCTITWLCKGWKFSADPASALQRQDHVTPDACSLLKEQ